MATARSKRTRGEALSTSEDDTVDNNQGNKQSKGSVNVGQESLDDKLQHGDEGCDNHDEYGDANLVGGDRLQTRDYKVGADEHRHRGKSH